MALDREDALPTNATERRRIQNRNAQRKFRHRKSLSKAAQAAQQESQTNVTNTSTKGQVHDATWAGALQSTSSTDTNAIMADDAPLHLHLDQIDCNAFTLDALAYPTPSIAPSLDPSTAFFSPSSLSTDGQDQFFGSMNPLSNNHHTVNSASSHSNSGSDFSSSYSPAARSRSYTPQEAGMPEATSGYRDSRCQVRELTFSDSESATYSRSVSNRCRIGMDLSTGDDWLLTLHIAAQKGHDRIVRMLLERDANIDQKDSEGKTALHHAVIGGFDNVVHILLAHGAQMKETDIDGRTSIHWAVIERRETVLKTLLDSYNRRTDCCIDALDRDGRTALHTAVEGGFEGGLQLLLQRGANLNIKARKKPLLGT